MERVVLKILKRWAVMACVVIALGIQTAESAEARVVCYYENWAVYRPFSGKFTPEDIDPFLCTHLIYAFGGMTDDNDIRPLDQYEDIEMGGFIKFSRLKTMNPGLKTLISIGGWNEGSKRFSALSASEERRKQLAQNAIKFLRLNKFDGLDLDWQYPAFRDGSSPKDRDNYVKMVQELREAFESEAKNTTQPRLLLSMAVPKGAEYINKGYDLPNLSRYLDWMSVLSYDYYSAQERTVNHHSALYPLPDSTQLNGDETINYYLNAGAEPSKLVMGIPTYGRSYTLSRFDSTGIGASADGPGNEGNSTEEKGYLAYYEICESILQNDKEDEKWTIVHYNESTMGPYAFKDNQWVSYDDPKIVSTKAEYVAQKGLGGIMFWAIDNDDFRGTCHGMRYPLIEAGKRSLFRSLGLPENYLPPAPASPSSTAASIPTVNILPVVTEAPEDVRTPSVESSTMEVVSPSTRPSTAPSKSFAPSSIAPETSVSRNTTAEPRVICYYASWSVYRPEAGMFTPEDIDPNLCTHLIYSYVNFTDDNELFPMDQTTDVEMGGYARFTSLKTLNPDLKTLISIGSWSEGSSRFSSLAASEERRRDLAYKAARFLRRNRFDGLDLDWEYPASREGSKPRDKLNYVKLVQALREEFESEARISGLPVLLLTMATPHDIEFINRGYDVSKLIRYLDWMNIRSFDYHTYSETTVNHHSPLFALEPSSQLNTDYTIDFYLKAGAEPEKLVLGIPTYGRSYTLRNPNLTDIWSSSVGPGTAGDYTQDEGYLSYFEICESFLMSNAEEGGEWTVVQNSPEVLGPYAFRDRQWVSYDDTNIVKKKAEYAANKGLGGIMFSGIDEDDFRGTCSVTPYPLIKAGKEQLFKRLGRAVSDESVSVTSNPGREINTQPMPKGKPNTKGTVTGTSKANKPQQNKGQETTNQDQNNISDSNNTGGIKGLIALIKSLGGIKELEKYLETSNNDLEMKQTDMDSQSSVNKNKPSTLVEEDSDEEDVPQIPSTSSRPWRRQYVKIPRKNPCATDQSISNSKNASILKDMKKRKENSGDDYNIEHNLENTTPDKTQHTEFEMKVRDSRIETNGHTGASHQVAMKTHPFRIEIDVSDTNILIKIV